MNFQREMPKRKSQKEGGVPPKKKVSDHHISTMIFFVCFNSCEIEKY